MRASPHSAGGGSGCPGTPWRSRLNRTPWLRRLGPRVRFDLNCIRPPQPSPAIVSHQVQKSRGRKRQRSVNHGRPPVSNAPALVASTSLDAILR